MSGAIEGIKSSELVYVATSTTGKDFPRAVDLGKVTTHDGKTIYIRLRDGVLYLCRMNNIDDVLQQLRQIVDSCRERGSAMGYFAALYHDMTAAVQRGIRQGTFEDGARMERLDVIFAKRYIDAYRSRELGWPTSRAWKAAFDAAEADEVSVLQHLLLGINAHINLDLGIAAAETSPGTSIWALERDFAAINTVIADLTTQVQDRLNSICPPLAFLDTALRTEDEGIADFSISLARRSSWQAATVLAFLQGDARERFIDGVDEGVAAFATRIQQPKGWVLRSALRVIRVSEIGSVREKMGAVSVMMNYE